MKRLCSFLVMLALLAILPSVTVNAESTTVRDIVCTYIRHMATIKWTPSESFMLYGDITRAFRAGKIYTGIPYTDSNVANLRTFRKNLNSSPTPQYIGETSQKKYVGISSAGAVYYSWAEISKTVSFRDESEMFPMSEKGTVAVGIYDYTGSTGSTSDIINMNTQEAIFESYAMLNPGDAIFTYTPQNKGNCKMVTSVSIVKNKNGSIDAENSRIFVIEQSSSMDISGSSTWRIGGEGYTFLSLYNDFFIPVTCKELAASDNAVDKPVIYVDEYEGGKNISIICKDKDAVIYYTTDGTTPTRSSPKYIQPIATTSNVTINAFAVSGLGKSQTVTRKIEVKETPAPTVTIEDHIEGKAVKAFVDDPDTAIYYTIDGGKPERYTSELVIANSCRINLYAVKLGGKRSKIVEKKITNKAVSTPVIAAPVSCAGGKKITVTCATPDVELYYTIDETEPTSYSKKFSSSLVIGSSCTIKIKAMKKGMTPSHTVSTKISMPTVKAPEITTENFIGGKRVIISCDTPDVKIYYTTDGSIPKTTGNRYTEPFIVTDEVNLRVLATRDGFETSQISKQIPLMQVSMPTIRVSEDLKVTLSCKTSGAVIYYTIGNKPIDIIRSKNYIEPFNVKKGETLTVFAVRKGLKNSEISTLKITGAVSTDSSMVLEGYNYPTALTLGDNYDIRGVIKSNYKIMSVTLGIYDESGHVLSQASASPQVKSADISYLNSELDFTKAVTGKNYYKIVASDMAGSKVLLNKQFTVKKPDEVKSLMTLTENTYPTILAYGQEFNFYGIIQSNFKIRKVTAGVFDTNGKSVDVYSCSPYSERFNLNIINHKIKFADLDTGTYYFRIIATDTVERKTLFNKAFTVSEKPENSQIKIRNAQYPDTITQGVKFQLQGKVQCEDIINSITAEVLSVDDKVIFYKTVYPNGTRYDISMLSDYLKLEYLESGIYRFKLNVETYNERKSIINKEFVVIDNNSGIVMNIDKIYSYNYNDAICTVNGKEYSVSSCGSSFTCLSMVYNYLSGASTVPDEILFKAYHEHIFNGEILTEKEILELASFYDIKVKLSNVQSDMISAIKSGNPVITRISNKGISSKCEYIVIKGYTDYDGEYVYINSPSSPVLSEKKIYISDLLGSLYDGIYVICDLS